jgi:hypothetical protein
MAALDVKEKEGFCDSEAIVSQKIRAGNRSRGSREAWEMRKMTRPRVIGKGRALSLSGQRKLLHNDFKRGGPRNGLQTLKIALSALGNLQVRATREIMLGTICEIPPPHCNRHIAKYLCF